MKWEILKGSEKDFEGISDYTNTICSLPDGSVVFTSLPSSELPSPHCDDIIAERRPISEPVVNQQLTTEWSGEGLPPIGVECKHLPAKHCVVPHKVTILAHTKLDSRDIEVAVFQYGDVISFSDAKQFIPIRSPEDTARDKAIHALEDIQSHPTDQDLRFSEYLYDAIADGKIPGVKLEVNHD